MSARRMRAPTHWQRLVPAGALALLTEGSAVGVPGKVERNVAVLFVDIEGCTRLCEALPAREMNDIIERYFPNTWMSFIGPAGKSSKSWVTGSSRCSREPTAQTT